MSFLLRPNTPISETGLLFQKVHKKEITPEKAALIFMTRENMLFNNNSYEGIKKEFTNSMKRTVKCISKTKSGTDCKRYNNGKGDYCTQHSNKN